MGVVERGNKLRGEGERVEVGERVGVQERVGAGEERE